MNKRYVDEKIRIVREEAQEESFNTSVVLALICVAFLGVACVGGAILYFVVMGVISVIAGYAWRWLNPSQKHWRIAKQEREAAARAEARRLKYGGERRK
jgi:hypothetical protein